MACSWSLLGRTPCFCLKVREKFELIKCAFLIFNLSNIKTLRPKANIALGLFTIQGQPPISQLRLSQLRTPHNTPTQIQKSSKDKITSEMQTLYPNDLHDKFPQIDFLSSGTNSRMSSILQSSAEHILTRTSTVTFSFLPNLAIKELLIPAASANSFFFMFLSIKSFHSLLQHTCISSTPSLNKFITQYRNYMQIWLTTQY